jgi:hypothetical protein
MVNEMVGIIQLKKYRTMKQRYGTSSENELSQKNGRPCTTSRRDTHQVMPSDLE